MELAKLAGQARLQRIAEQRRKTKHDAFRAIEGYMRKLQVSRDELVSLLCAARRRGGVRKIRCLGHYWDTALGSIS
jgi:hypothetical protein